MLAFKFDRGALKEKKIRANPSRESRWNAKKALNSFEISTAILESEARLSQS